MSEGELLTGLDRQPNISYKSAELRKLEHIAKPFTETLGSIHHTLVGDAGVIVSFDRLKPMAGGNWILFDLDETVFQFTDAKEKRLQTYGQLLNQLGISISNDQINQLMTVTDQFSRWAEEPDQSPLYHVEAHMMALSWLTKQIVSAQNNGENLNEVIQTRITRLHEIETGEIRQVSDPFHFENKKLVLHSKQPWSHGKKYVHGEFVTDDGSASIDDVFKRTIFKPRVFEELVKAITALGNPKDSIHRFNIAFFTKGKKGFQEYKALELMREYPDLPISQIWITEHDKGDFILEAIDTDAFSEPELAYVPGALEDSPGESISYGFGYPLGALPHILIHIDDDRKQIESILKANDTYRPKGSARERAEQERKARSLAEFVCIQSIEPGTKNAGKRWQVATPYGVLDFTAGNITADEISLIIKINTYLKLRGLHGEKGPYQQWLKDTLLNAGIDLTDLEKNRKKY